MRIGFYALAGLVLLSSSAQATIVFADDVRNSRFVSFDTLTPGTQTVLATAYTANYFGMDFDATGATLFGVRTNATALTHHLESLSLVNGAALTTVQITGLDTGATVTGLTFNAANNAFLSAGGAAGYKLYNLNTVTGATTLIGTMHATNIIIDVAMDSGGNMVAHDITTDAFHFVNTSTGALTLIGPHGLAANFAQGMDFDWSNNTLYAAVYTGGGTLTYGSVNLTTGAVTSIPGIVSGEYEMAVRSGIVPEPATIAVLGLGAAALLRRRRKQ